MPLAGIKIDLSSDIQYEDSSILFQWIFGPLGQIFMGIYFLVFEIGHLWLSNQYHNNKLIFIFTFVTIWQCDWI